MDWQLADSNKRLKVMIAVSKGSHVLADLLHRWSRGDLPIDITAVVGNHETLRGMTEWHGVKFVYLPVTSRFEVALGDKVRGGTDVIGRLAP